MPSMFVRGNILSVLNADAHSVSNKGLHSGDTLRVSARKKGGWLRVRCSRTGEVFSIRSGRHLCLKSQATRPASQIDLLTRENQIVTAEQRAKVDDATIKSLTAAIKYAHSECNATRGVVEHLQERIAYYQNLQLEWHDAHDQMARQQLRLEQQLQQLRADSCHADMAYHARVSELEGQLEKFLRADEDDSPVEEDDLCDDGCQDSRGDYEALSNKLRMQADDPLALGRIGLHTWP